MRENRKGFDINPRRTTVSETKSLIDGHGYISDEFRPLEEVEDEETLKGPKSFVDINEVSAVDDEYLTTEDRMAAELDRKRQEESEEEKLIESDFDDVDKKDDEDLNDEQDIDAGGSIVLDAPHTRQLKRNRDNKLIKEKGFFKKSQQRDSKPLYKDFRKSKTTKRY